MGDAMSGINIGNGAVANLEDLVIHDGVFSVDAEQRISHWSATAAAMMGLQARDVIGKRCYEVIGGRDSRNYNYCRRNCPIIENARRGRPTQSYDVLHASPDGEQKWLNVSIAFWKGTSSKDRNVVHFIRDVTQRRQMEEFARKAGSALRELLEEGSYRDRDERPVSRKNLEDVSPVPMPKLSRRESEVLRLLAAGVTTRQIADTLDIKLVTARNHINRLLTKLGVNSRLQAVVYASQHKII